MILDFLKTKTAVAASMKDLLESARVGSGFEKATDTTISTQLGSIVQYLLSFLGVIFVVLTIYAGFLWMTARGESDQVDKAKDIMKNSVIGLIIVLSANVITHYVIVNFLIG